MGISVDHESRLGAWAGSAGARLRPEMDPVLRFEIFRKGQALYEAGEGLMDAASSAPTSA